MKNRVEREFKDPDIKPPNSRSFFYWLVIIVVLLMVGFVFGTILIDKNIISGDMRKQLVFSENINETKKTPEYISVRYIDSTISVMYNNTVDRDICVNLDVVSDSYVFPIRVYKTSRLPPCEVIILDRDWGTKYIVSIDETVKNETFTYYWSIFKMFPGYAVVKQI